MLGYPNLGFESGFYPGSRSIGKEEIEAVQEVLRNQGYLSENTRLVKSGSDDQAGIHFEVKIASAKEHAPKALASLSNQSPVALSYGDHANDLARIIHELGQAQHHSANELQVEIVKYLISSLEGGNWQEFKKHQELWVQDAGPQVEMAIGFIESYQDPHGVRASWSGLVAVSNKSQAETYENLLDLALDFIHELPWNSNPSDNNSFPFENPKFIKPDFASIDVLAYSSSEVWSGVMLPGVILTVPTFI
jgi:dipeptidyl-peptidase-3